MNLGHLKKVESNYDNSEVYMYTWNVVRNCGRKNNHWDSECFVLVPGNILFDYSFPVHFHFFGLTQNYFTYFQTTAALNGRLQNHQ